MNCSNKLDIVSVSDKIAITLIYNCKSYAFFRETGCKIAEIEPIYRSVDDKVEFLTKTLDIILNRIMSNLFVVVPVIASIWRYYSSDYSNEAFLQIYPAM